MYFVFRFLNKYGRVLFVGDAISKEEIQTYLNDKNWLSEEQHEQIDKIEFIECSSPYEMDALRDYLTCLWRPPFNTVFEQEFPFAIATNEISWQDIADKNDRRIILCFPRR